jgi:hypothetical protein
MEAAKANRQGHRDASRLCCRPIPGASWSGSVTREPTSKAIALRSRGISSVGKAYRACIERKLR